METGEDVRLNGGLAGWAEEQRAQLSTQPQQPAQRSTDAQGVSLPRQQQARSSSLEQHPPPTQMSGEQHGHEPSSAPQQHQPPVHAAEETAQLSASQRDQPSQELTNPTNPDADVPGPATTQVLHEQPSAPSQAKSSTRSRICPSIPGDALSLIAVHLHGYHFQNLRLVNSAHRAVLQPTHIRLLHNHAPLLDGLMHASPMHVTQLTARCYLPTDRTLHRTGVLRHNQLSSFQVFVRAVSTACESWQNVKCATLLLHATIMSPVLMNSSLRELQLVDDGCLQSLVQPCLGPALSLLGSCTNLTHLQISLSSFELEPQHITVLTTLTQLQHLGINTSQPAPFKVKYADIVPVVNKLTQLTSLEISVLAPASASESWLKLGPLPWLLDLNLRLMLEDLSIWVYPDNSQFIPATFSQLASVRKLTLQLAQNKWQALFYRECFTYLPNLTDLDIAHRLDKMDMIALQGCSQLTRLKAHSVRCRDFNLFALPRLVDLHVESEFSCGNLHVVAPSLTTFRCDHAHTGAVPLPLQAIKPGTSWLRCLEDHPVLQRVHIPVAALISADLRLSTQLQAGNFTDAGAPLAAAPRVLAAHRPWLTARALSRKAKEVDDKEGQQARTAFMPWLSLLDELTLVSTAGMHAWTVMERERAYLRKIRCLRLEYDFKPRGQVIIKVAADSFVKHVTTWGETLPSLRLIQVDPCLLAVVLPEECRIAEQYTPDWLKQDLAQQRTEHSACQSTPQAIAGPVQDSAGPSSSGADDCCLPRGAQPMANEMNGQAQGEVDGVGGELDEDEWIAMCHPEWHEKKAEELMAQEQYVAAFLILVARHTNVDKVQFKSWHGSFETMATGSKAVEVFVMLKRQVSTTLPLLLRPVQVEYL